MILSSKINKTSAKSGSTVSHRFRTSQQRPSKGQVRLSQIANVNHLQRAIYFTRNNSSKLHSEVEKARIRKFCDQLSATELSKQLLSGAYKPSPVRSVSIPKANGKERELGIPEPLDRIVGTAIKMTLEPLCEKYMFLDCSYAYRPNRSTADAAKKLLEYCNKQGMKWCFKTDIQKFFDNIYHKQIQQTLKEYFKIDAATTSYLNEIMKAGKRIGDKVYPTKIGVTQGGILSPLFSNIIGNVIDRELAKHGIVHVRYADDLILMARNEDDCIRGRYILESCLAALKLSIHPDKSEIAPLEKITYLGYGFHNGQIIIPEHKIAKLVKDLADTFNNTVSNNNQYEVINSKVNGWLNYYHRANPLLPDEDSIAKLIEYIHKSSLPINIQLADRVRNILLQIQICTTGGSR